ncbi:nuclease-related domain-containing protein [Kocuria salina]|uniref:nuclease-related domain-containing protein n=1 Tax=Kocuria salina TaxID=1929416 RepID=UPI0020D1278D|nr:nuclease-related domain-containing protein [Kocuria salina]
MTPSVDPALPPPAPIRTAGFAVFRLLGPPAEARAPTPESNLANRRAGQAVMAETLRIHDGDPPRSWWRRLVGSSPLSADSRPWFQGALGEIAVGQILGRLGPEWTVLHAVPVGAGVSDIDHVLIGPAGVFTLNTKNHAGRNVWIGERAILIDGHKQHYLPHARHEAARAAKRLSAAVGEPVSVTPVLVLIEPGRLTIKRRPADVGVVTDRELLRWLKRRRPVLAPERIARIAAAAVVPGTWHHHPAPPEDPVALQERFAELMQIVRSARRRRRLWSFGLFIGAGAAMVNHGPNALTALLSTGLS